MNNLAKVKMVLGAACAAAAAALGYLGYVDAAHCVTAIASATLVALGANAIGEGLGK